MVQALNSTLERFNINTRERIDIFLVNVLMSLVLENGLQKLQMEHATKTEGILVM